MPHTLVVEIIPAILVKTERGFRQRLAAVEPFVSWAQLDVVDGEFAPNVTWGDPRVLEGLETPVRFEIDLMVADPGIQITKWLSAKPNVRRIFFHFEAVSSEAARQRRAGGEAAAHNFITRIKEANIEAGMSLNPKTPVSALWPFAQRLDAVLLLGVEPGFGGQALQPDVVEKVVVFHEKHPRIPVTVDGGVNAGNARALVKAGAARLAAGSFIFNHPMGPRVAIEGLQEASRNGRKS